MQETKETQVQSLGPEDPLEEGMATHSSILTWRIPWTEECVGLQSVRLQRVGTGLKRLGTTMLEKQDVGSTPWVRRHPGVGSGDPFQYSYLKNSTVSESGQSKVSDVTEHTHRQHTSDLLLKVNCFHVAFTFNFVPFPLYHTNAI